MSRVSQPQLPSAFFPEAARYRAEYTQLSTEYAVTVRSMAELAMQQGQTPETETNALALYTLDDVEDGVHDDFANRLLVRYHPAARKATADDVPRGALLSQAVQPPASAPAEFRKQHRNGLYITSIALQREIPMRKMPPGSTSFDARNYSHIIHTLGEHEITLGEQQVRYTVDPQGGRHEAVQAMPVFKTLIEQAYGQVVLGVVDSAVVDPLRAAYAEAAREDALNPNHLADKQLRYRWLARGLDNPSPHIRGLVEAMDSTGSDFGAALVGKLMLADIATIAELGTLKSDAYYDRRRGRVSFLQRLTWVKDNAADFQRDLNVYLQMQRPAFSQALDSAIKPVRDITAATTHLSNDTRQPAALPLDGTHWRINRVL